MSDYDVSVEKEKEQWEKAIEYGDTEDFAPRAITEYSRATALLLKEILLTLREMKQQERDYWETWKEAKSEERGKVA